jgi:hypothetical protein
MLNDVNRVKQLSDHTVRVAAESGVNLFANKNLNALH